MAINDYGADEVMSEIVKFTLDKYGIKASWKIIPLTKEKWIKLSVDIFILEDYLKYIVEESLLEYGKHSTFFDNLSYLATMMQIEGFKELFRIKKLRKELPFYYQLFKKNKVRDFLILLNVALTSERNKSLTSEDSKREKLQTLVHETIHYIQNVSGTRNYESINKEADIIVDEFQILREKKMIKKHGNAD